MIEFLRGRLLAVEDDALVLDVHGVGVRARIADGGFFRRRIGKEITVPAALVIEPRAVTLYAFGTPGERSGFVWLLRVPGIGGTTALKLLPHAEALRRGELETLPAVEGVGAARMAKLARFLKREAGAPARGPAGDRARELKAALRALGLSSAEAGSRADRALARQPNASLEALVRLAVKP